MAANLLPMVTFPRRLTGLKQGVLRIHHWLLPPAARVGWMPYLWLPYLAFVFVAWVNRVPGPLEMGATLLALAVFLVLYFRGYQYRSYGRELGFVTGSTLALALVLLPINPGATVFAVYAATFAGTLAPRKRALYTLGLVLLVPTVEAELMGWNGWTWSPAMGVAFLMGLYSIYFSEIKRKDEALRLSHEEIRRLAARAERERIARDLHDLLGHTLSVIALKAELAGKLAARDSARAAVEVGDIEHIAREALQEVRSAVQGYRAGSLHAELARARSACAAAAVELMEDVACECTPQEATVLAPVLREAVTNLIRHARAQHASVALSRRDGSLCLSVIDDGRGGPLREGNGIGGMRERLAAVGGRLDIEADGRGTRLLAWMPGRARPPAEATEGAAA